MSKLILSNDLVGETVRGTALVTASQVRSAVNGDYVSCTMTTGEQTYEAKRWKSSSVLRVGSVYQFIGTVDSYKGKLNLNIKGASIVDLPVEDYYKHGPNDTERLFQQLLELVQSCDSDNYKKVGLALLDQYEEDCKTSVAAKGVHHDYYGGWIQHTYEVVLNARSLANTMQSSTNEEYNIDLITIGALLHDIGKFKGYYFDHGDIDLTTEGKFNEHIILGCVMLDRLCTTLNVPEIVKTLLTHCIVSHHGKLEWGSPVMPVCPEAYFIHIADLVSSQMSIYANEKVENSEWSDRSYFLKVPVYCGKRDE